MIKSGLDSVDEAISEDFRNPDQEMQINFDNFDVEFDLMDLQKNEEFGFT